MRAKTFHPDEVQRIQCSVHAYDTFITGLEHNVHEVLIHIENTVDGSTTFYRFTKQHVPTTLQRLMFYPNEASTLLALIQ